MSIPNIKFHSITHQRANNRKKAARKKKNNQKAREEIKIEDNCKKNGKRTLKNAHKFEVKEERGKTPIRVKEKIKSLIVFDIDELC
jgi:hypothetical protein